MGKKNFNNSLKTIFKWLCIARVNWLSFLLIKYHLSNKPLHKIFFSKRRQILKLLFSVRWEELEIGNYVLCLTWSWIRLLFRPFPTVIFSWTKVRRSAEDTMDRTQKNQKVSWHALISWRAHGSWIWLFVRSNRRLLNEGSKKSPGYHGQNPKTRKLTCTNILVKMWLTDLFHNKSWK